ncbi:hypothetical protein CIB48_g3044 [Xylaria polymorpha]|nr:hypothetical protein CIB48_g3044 [Xylaria polymorpha]
MLDPSLSPPTKGQSQRYTRERRSATGTSLVHPIDLGILDLEAESGHAGLVLVDDGLAIARGIVRLREEHAVVSTRLLVFAHTAWLHNESTLIIELAAKTVTERWDPNLGLGGCCAGAAFVFAPPAMGSALGEMDATEISGALD